MMKARRDYTLTYSSGSQGTKEVQQMLLIDFIEPIEVTNHLIRFRRQIAHASAASMVLNRFDQILRAAVVQEKDSLPEAPQGRRAELVSTGVALAHIVGKARPHVMECQIGVQVDVLVLQ